MRPHRKQLAALVVAAASALTGALATGDVRAVEPPVPAAAPAGPSASARWSGQAAVDRLAERLPAVAAAHGKSPDELRSLLLADPTLHVDARDALLFVDEPVGPDQAIAAASWGVFDPDPAIPDSDTFLLHSRPGAPRVIYIDFDGHSLQGTAWTGATPCYAEPYDFDGNASSFSVEELAAIKTIWRRVAEDYAPFDVDVTTQDPGADAINRSSRADDRYGARAVVTTSTPRYPCGDYSPTLYRAACMWGCGGVAYTGVVDRTDNGYYQPALVFTNGTYDTCLCLIHKFVAESVTHEVGHMLGLSHDGLTLAWGTNPPAQYLGQGAWAPIMGQGTARPIVQWSKGEYPFASNPEDDLGIITTRGLSFRPDDHGDTARASTAISIGSVLDGVIGTAADVDAFRFSAVAGSTATLTADPVPVSPNLDVRLEVRTSRGVLLASSDPAPRFSTTDPRDVATGMGASITFTAPANDTYTVLVSGVGSGSPTADGYSDYGSLGSYRLTYGVAPVVRLTATPTTGPDPLTVTFTGSASIDPAGGPLGFEWDFGNGITSSLADPSHAYSLPGTYLVTLRATGSTGRSAFASITITVLQRIDVSAISASGAFARGSANATATVTVLDTRTGQSPRPVAGATVSGTWSVGNTVVATRTATTDTNGIAALSSGSVKATAGTVLRFCVTQLAKPGSAWTTGLFAPSDATDCAAWTVG